MPSTPESISKINVTGEEHPIDAVTVEGKNVSELQTLFSDDFQLKSNLVTSIDSNSTDLQYMSAKCLYDMIWSSGGEHQDEPLFDYSQEYLTFDVVDGGTITWKTSSSNNTKTISYSLNNGDWTPITSTTSGVSINVNSGDKVKFKGNNSTYSTSSSYNYFNGTATFNTSGNIMSLIGGDDFSELDTLTDTYTFDYLFRQSKIISCRNLILPATTLTDHCYTSMFSGCTGLTEAPELPATTLANYCYTSMFYGCTGLTEAPELSVTTLAQNCYSQMFRGCTSLTEAPELPAETLVNYCYAYMFYGCTNLNSIKVLGTRTVSNQCATWVVGVSSTGTFYHKQGVSWSSGTSGCPSGWTKIAVQV